MRKISICDITLRESSAFLGNHLPFKIKIELARLLSQLGVSVIEAPPLINGKTDYFLIKSLSSTIRRGTLSVPIDILDSESPSRTWNALKDAASGRLVVPVPVSTVQMEYFCHLKPDGILKLISERVSECASYCKNVEFVAGDFGRSDRDFLKKAITTAVDAGAQTITVGDAAGNLLPDEFYESIKGIREILPEGISLGVYCCNDNFLADACALAAVQAGADEIKTMSLGNNTVSLKRFPKMLNVHSEKLGAGTSIALSKLQHGVARIENLCKLSESKSGTAIGSLVDALEGNIKLSPHEDKDAVIAAAQMLGYDLSDEDCDKVYESFKVFSNGRSVIEAKELDAIVASVAFQVPPTYKLESFVVNNGNTITATCHLLIRKDGELLESICTGDGPIDAAFIAIDKAVGKHYELDDFQIRSVTEGREALGETVVRLRFEGKVFSGRGVSKDIVVSSVMAYLNAINKIAYGEELN